MGNVRKEDRCHLGHKSPEHRSWTGMKTRCYNKNYPGYGYYGGRGIKVCDRWKNSFKAFVEDMGQKPTPKHTLERKDVDGDYEPGNCSWETMAVQCNNRRNEFVINAMGISQSTAGWSKVFGVNMATINSRIRRGWEPEDAVSRKPAMMGGALKRRK